MEMIATEIDARIKRIIPPLYRESDESRFPQEVWDRVQEWPFQSRGLGILGGSGTCKTRMVYALLENIIDGPDYLTILAISHTCKGSL